MEPWLMAAGGRAEIEQIANCIDGNETLFLQSTGFLSASLIDADDQ
jgi:hypothetical protein